jgi:hypothetical protein
MTLPAAEDRTRLAGLVSRLVSQLFELEAVIHREAFRRAERAEIRGARALDLRVLVVQASQSLDDLRALADRRGVSLVSFATVWRDTIHCVRGGILDHVLAPRPSDLELGVVIGALRRGIGIARHLEDAATDEGDPVLAAFCRRWLASREPLVASLATLWARSQGVDARPMPRLPAARRRGRRRPRSGPPASPRFDAQPSSARW